MKDAEIARNVWENVLGLINSGTPIEGIKSIAENQIKGLDSWISRFHEEEG